MNNRTGTPDIALPRHFWYLGTHPFRGATSIGLRHQRREAEISEHELRDGMIAGDLVAEEYVSGLNVAMNDSRPAPRWEVGIFFPASDAKVEKGKRFGQLNETVPQERFRTALFACSRYIAVQIAPLAVFEVHDQIHISLQEISSNKFDNPRVMGQYFFENVHLDGHVAEHGVDFLFLAYQKFPVAFPLHQADFALATLA